ncbi:hypothetical protein [Streptomyces mirabilis]
MSRYLREDDRIYIAGRLRERKKLLRERDAYFQLMQQGHGDGPSRCPGPR